jgi:hypothetical protein
MRRCFPGQASIVRRDLLAVRGRMGRGNLALRIPASGARAGALAGDSFLRLLHLLV